MDASLFSIQPAAAEPIYRQMVEQTRRMMASGQLSGGEAMPSVRDVAAHHAINPMTVSKAYSLLEMEGLLERQRGKGMVVAVQQKKVKWKNIFMKIRMSLPMHLLKPGLNSRTVIWGHVPDTWDLMFLPKN